MNQQLLKPPKTKAPRPVESFGPEILAALLRGATEPLTLDMSYKMGIRFRLRIHQLREAMRRQAHEKYELVARVRVSIEWPDGTALEKQGRYWVPRDRNTKCRITLKPNDAEFAAALSAAGIDPLSGVTSSDLPTEPAERPRHSTPVSTLEDMLKDFSK